MNCYRPLDAHKIDGCYLFGDTAKHLINLACVWSLISLPEDPEFQALPCFSDVVLVSSELVVYIIHVL
jgi:hypothetical protein